jgi:hypothetical protein
VNGAPQNPMTAARPQALDAVHVADRLVDDQA